MTCRRPLYTTTLTLFALLFILCPRARAQEPATPTATPDAQPTPAPQTQKLRFLAYDGKGDVLGELKRENVHVFFDEVEQPVESFAVDVSPASYGLVVDNTGSLRTQIGAVVAASKALAYNNKPSDETFVVRFVSSDNIRMMQEFTNDKPPLVKTIETMSVEGGQTAMLDALYVSADYLSKHVRPDAEAPRRRALVLISDGEDRNSFYKYEQVMKLLREADVQVFAIGLTSQLDNTGVLLGKSHRDKSVALLERLTSETGGRVFFVKKVGELKEAIAEIDKSLHAQYVVGFTPPATAAPSTKDKKHKLEVRAFGANGTDKLKVVLRPERAAPAPAGEEKKKKKKDEDKKKD